jgi:FkbM family methyltransferase
LYDFSKVPFKPDLVIDCGAHVGFFSLLAAHHWPGVPILAFEPDPQNAGVARENFSRNKLSGTVLPAAVGKSKGWACFDSAGGMGYLSEGGGISVPVIDLPKLLTSIPSARCVMKMDIEGAEMELLPDVLAAISGSAAVFVELHSGEENCLRLERECAALGFTPTRMRERVVHESGMHFVDAFMIRISDQSDGLSRAGSGSPDGRAD